MMIAVGSKMSEMIAAYDKMAPLSEREVNTVHYKKVENRWMEIEQHQHVTTEDEEKYARQETKIYKWTNCLMEIAIDR